MSTVTADPLPVRADLRLAAPVLAAWVVAGIGIGMPEAAGPAAIAAAVLTAVGLASSSVLRRPGAMLVLVLAFALSGTVLCSVAVRIDGRRPSELVEAAEAGRAVEARATTTQTVPIGSGSFTVVLTDVRIGEARLGGSVPARVFGPPGEREHGIGTVLSVSGTLAVTDPADSVAFLFFPGSPPRSERAPPASLEWANSLRAGFREAASALPGDGGALLPGLAIGDTSAVGDDLDAAMKTSSLSHLTAVSGANCAVVVGLIMLGGRALSLPRSWRIAASVAVLLGFVVLVTPEPSVLRASVMVCIVLVALSRGRPVRGVPVLAFAVIVLLVVDPWLAREYGFVLSVLATGGLLVLAGPLTARLSRWMPQPLAAAIAIPLAAQLACQSVLILLAPVVPTYGVIANMLAGPAAPVATVIGLAACVLLAVAPPLGVLAAKVAWLPSAWIAGVATTFSSAPLNTVPWIGGVLGTVLLAVATLIALVVFFTRSARIRRLGALVLAAALVCAVTVAAAAAVRTALTRPADWQYAVCDVGQGDAVLVRSGDRTALVDTGPEPEALERCLDTLGVARIDLLVLTHFDLDHVGGTEAVADRTVEALIGPSDGADADRLVESLRASGVTVRQAGQGQRGILGDLRWNVLWPTDPLRGTEPGNDASVAILFDAVGTCGSRCLSSVFLGDLGEQQQQRLLGATALPAVDVVKVAHHGSADQSDRLYDTLRARVALIGVGAENGYGHPTERLLGMLARSGTEATRTDRNGLVLIAPAPGGSIRVWSER